MNIETYRTQLDTLNQGLATLAGKAKLTLVCQTGESEQDPLYLYGIMGGKDVGKTTFINQLAGSRISIDTDILDEGTRIAVAYCHQEDRATLQRRFAAEVRERLRYETHTRSELKNVVLIDFPDFDSRFVSHRHDVQILARYLQGILWILSPRKYADHEFLDQYQAMAQSNENHFMIMNKVDQLEEISQPEAIREKWYSYMKEVCNTRKIFFPERERLLLISAMEPEKFDFPLIQDRLIRIHTPHEILKAKAHNLKSEFSKNIQGMRSYYALNDRIAEIDDALDALRIWVSKTFSEHYLQTVQERVAAIEPIQQRVSAGLFRRRVEGWPILRVLFYPLAGLTAYIAGRFSFLTTNREKEETTRDLLRYDGDSASNRIQQIRLQLEDHYPTWASELGEMPPYAENVTGQFNRLLQRYEENLGERLSKGITPPSRLSKSVVIYTPLVWIPFLQPLLLQWATDSDTGLFSALIQLTGAGTLLESALFLLLYYLTVLVILYARGARRIQEEGKDEIQSLWHEQFLPWIEDLLSQPIVELRQRWNAKKAELDTLEKEITQKLDQLMGG
ncbi:MAG: GTPase domain-containing protein [bacterium]|jgi:hypothetical protein|nr:GTPase domain-containing protein [bacterium]